jgi:pilus assembly protein CpaC
MPRPTRAAIAASAALAMLPPLSHSEAQTTGAPTQAAAVDEPVVPTVPAPRAADPVTTLPPEDGAPLELIDGSSTVLTFDERIERVVVVDPTIADSRPVSANQVVVFAKAPGATSMVLRLESGRTMNHRVRVTLDAEALQSRLRRIFAADLEVEELDGLVALRGRMPSIATGKLVTDYMNGTGLKWIDSTVIAGVQQVQLRVRIAEASRTALRALAVSAVAGGNSVFGGIQSPGGSPFQPVSIAPAPLSPINGSDFRFRGDPVSSATTLFGGVTGSNLEIYLQALNENRYVRVLAEPNLVAVSGQTATFLVGGEVPIPIVQGSVVGGGSTITIEYKEFGIRLNFRPEVLGSGRLRLEVAPEVSELSQIGAVNQNGFTIPSLVTRRSQTTVELGNGQSFAMAGLLRTLEQATSAKVPVLGDMPILGPLFRSMRYEEAQTELVVIVTADLVEPLDDGMDRPLPGDLHASPNDWELFLEGEIHGEVAVGHPMARLKALGLGGLKGPGAWRRSDQTRILAADPLPANGGDAAGMEAQ